ncbi:uncharacterized protein B0H18DRAFT_1126580 [Fomitopsis serialis]|uniref:uncharacterized protein n=1 Tax=Fomitopsis serialis TaxID=139415 RepID=UPI0020073084|nr:uncharacterized protein B0H18DRAFT_1126580 [Neoantrodia serialis]KAH9913112.1 hypothetical protein B0H18DRAFT_1126580 [Neoantrodia serialis]
MKVTSAIFLSAAALFHAACAVPLGEIDGQLSGRASKVYVVTDDIVERTGNDVDSPSQVTKNLDKRGSDLYTVTDDVVKRDGGIVAYNELDESL